ncbi:MAG: stage II sporulation protein R [Syntrophomonadaceae bacterium]|nr:stage II sporulation protein R [Syntrophomonadaceae bacterium]
MKYRNLTVMVLALGIILCGAAAQQSGSVYAKVLRLHVQANSDSVRDQALKLEVRDAVVEYMREELASAEDLREAEALARAHRDEITACAVRTLAENGCHEPVAVYIGGDNFPEKAYGDLVLPAGRYQAVRVVIGSGQGQNWWCVLFPPLCLLSSSEDGLALSDPEEREVAFKCLELLPEGLQASIGAKK